MKFFQSLLRKIKAKTTLRTYQKPLAVTLISLLLINFIILFIAAAISLGVDNKYYSGYFFHGKFLEAFVTSVKWMITANSINNYDAHEHLYMLIVAAFVVVIEMVLFSGAIIAIITTSLRHYIDVKSKAKGRIQISNHFVILNWNSKVPDMIYNLMLKGFKENIVILSNQNKEYIENEVKSLFLANDIVTKAKARLIVKEGDPLLRGNLDDISIEKASQIVVMAREDMSDGDDDNILNSDLLNLKIVLRLGSFNLSGNCQVVVETDSDSTRGQIENLAFKVKSLIGKHIIPVSFNKKIGQIIAQSIVCPEMSDVYLHLFSFDDAEFYSIDSNESIEEFNKHHNEAIACAKLNKLYVLQEDEKEYLKRREKAYESSFALTKRIEPVKSVCTIFVVGDNKKSKFILDNLNRSADSRDFKYTIKTYHKNENELLVSDIRETKGEKKVLILSDDTVSEESYDANVFVTLIALTKAFPKRDGLTFITELLDSRNLSSVRDFDIHNTIISNKMMSLLITQLAMNLDSRDFFDKILTVDRADDTNEFDIAIKKASEMIYMEKPLTFKSKAELLSAFYKCFEGKNILIGLCKGEEILLLNENQDEKSSLVVDPMDSFIYFKY